MIDSLYKINEDCTFNVEKQPIYYLDTNNKMEQEIEVPNRYALVNTRTKKPLNVVSNKYKIRRYKDLIYKVNDVINQTNLSKNITVTDWLHPKGTKFRRDVYFWDHAIPVKDHNREKTIPHLRIYSSYDSTWAEQIIFGSVYVLCMNGLVRPEWQFKVYNRHNSSSDTVYTAEMFKEGLEAQKHLGRELFKLMQRKVYDEQVNILFKTTLAKISRNSLVNSHSDIAMRELGDLWDHYCNSYGHTMFAVYQSATHWSSHPITKGNPQMVSRKREKQVINMMNSRIWNEMIGG
jgi:hypothetical protein